MKRIVEIEQGPYGGKVLLERRTPGWSWEWAPFSGGHTFGWASSRAEAAAAALAAAERRHEFETVSREIRAAQERLTWAMEKLRDLESR